MRRRLATDIGDDLLFRNHIRSGPSATGGNTIIDASGLLLSRRVIRSRGVPSPHARDVGRRLRGLAGSPFGAAPDVQAPIRPKLAADAGFFGVNQQGGVQPVTVQAGGWGLWGHLWPSSQHTPRTRRLGRAAWPVVVGNRGSAGRGRATRRYRRGRSPATSATRKPWAGWR